MPTKLNPNFFKRDKSGLVKLRINLSEEEALLLEEAAGDVPVMIYLHRALGRVARSDIKRAQRDRSPHVIDEEP